MLYLYPETIETLKKIQETIPDLNENELREIENILFLFHNQSYYKGIIDGRLMNNMGLTNI